MIQRRSAKAGIQRHIHPHVFRHTFASNMLRTGENIYTTARALGHSRISTTEIYLHMADTEVEEAGVRASMLNKRGREVWEL
jgi:site-specific recombinase XerD